MKTVEVSAKLSKLLDQLSSAVSSTFELLEKIKNQAEEDGLSVKDTRELVVGALKKRGLADRTIRNYLPDALKNKAMQQVRNVAKSATKSEKTTEAESPLVSTPSEPYSKGAPEDREATRPEKQGMKIQELSQLCLQKDKTIEQLQEQLINKRYLPAKLAPGVYIVTKHENGNEDIERAKPNSYNKDVTQELIEAKQEIKRLSQAFEFEDMIEINGQQIPVKGIARAPTQSGKVMVNTVKAKEMYA